MSARDGLANDVSGAAHLPAHVAARVTASRRRQGGRRRCGSKASRPRSRTAGRRSKRCSKPFGALATLDEAASRALWKAVRDVSRLRAGDDAPLWRISTAPTRGHEIAAAIGEGGAYFYDWAGGLIWVGAAAVATTAAPRACARAVARAAATRR